MDVPGGPAFQTYLGQLGPAVAGAIATAAREQVETSVKNKYNELKDFVADNLKNRTAPKTVKKAPVSKPKESAKQREVRQISTGLQVAKERLASAARKYKKHAKDARELNIKTHRRGTVFKIEGIVQLKHP